MSIISTIISMVAVVGVATVGILFYGSICLNIIRGMKHNKIVHHA